MTKNIILGMLLLAVFMPAFPQQNPKTDGYKIHGNIAGKYEGKVYLTEKIGAKLVRLDSAETQSGQYTFEGGNVKFPRQLFIEGHDDQQAPFFLENGIITIHTANPNFFWWSTQGGTINNEIFQKFRMDETYSTVDSVRSEFMIHQLRHGRGDYEVENAAFKRRSAESTERSRQLAQGIVNRFPDELIALYMLRNVIGYKMEAEELEQALKTIHPKFADHPYMADVKNLLSSKKTGEGNTAPLFETKDINGKKVTLADYRGKYVLIDFWASWCSPCIREIPKLQTLHRKYSGGKKFEIIGISLDKDETKWKTAIKKHNMAWTQVCDLDAWDSDIAKKYNVMAVPHTVLVDPAGKIVALDLRGDELVKKIEELVK